MGEGGIIPLTDEYLIAARKIADRAGAMLVFDEIQCGLGRTGHAVRVPAERHRSRHRHAGQAARRRTAARRGARPATAIEGCVKPGHHGTTFGGNPVACRLGAVVLDEIEEAAAADQRARRVVRRASCALSHAPASSTCAARA